jgi:hypothetical protein
MPKGLSRGGPYLRIFELLPRVVEILRRQEAAKPVDGRDEPSQADALIERLVHDLNSPRLAGLFTCDPPSPRLTTLIRNASPCRRYALVTLAIRHSYSLRFVSPDTGLSYANLAISVLRKTRVKGFSPELVFDLAARALAVRANFRRLASRFTAAQTDFRRAHFFLGHGTNDPIELAFLQRLEASLRIDRGDFVGARRSLESALRTYRRSGHCDLPYVLLGLGIVSLHLDNHGRAQALFEEALSLPSDASLALAAHHNFALSLVFEGRSREALAFFLTNRDLRESVAPPSYQHRSSWLAGLIYSELGWLEQAEQAFVAAREGYSHPPLPYELAKVSAELALVRFQMGHPEDVRELLEPVLPYLLEERLLLDARAALLLILRADEVQALSLGLLQELVGYLRRREYNPGLSLPRAES